MGYARLDIWLDLHTLAVASGDPLLDWLSRAGAVGVMALIIVGFVRGWIVPSPEVDRLVKENEQVRLERDRALDLVYKQAEVSMRAVQALEETKDRWSHLDQ